MPSGCSSDQPRVMVGLSGWSAFSGVYLFLSASDDDKEDALGPELRHQLDRAVGDDAVAHRGLGQEPAGPGLI